MPYSAVVGGSFHRHFTLQASEASRFGLSKINKSKTRKKIGRNFMGGPNRPQSTRLPTGGAGFAPVRAPHRIIGHGPAVLRFERARYYARVVLRPIVGRFGVGIVSEPF